MSELLYSLIAGKAFNEILDEHGRHSAQGLINDAFSEWSGNRQEIFNLGADDYNSLPLESALHEIARERAEGIIDQDSINNITRAVAHNDFGDNVGLSDLFLAKTDFRGYNLKNADISNSDFTGSNFSEQYFEFQSLRNNIFDDVDFSNAIIRNTSFKGSSLINSDFSSSRGYSSSGLYTANFQDCNLSGADFTNADIYAVDFRGADLTGASFENAVFRNKGIGHIQMDINSLTEADFTSANGMEEITFYTEDGKEIIGMDWVDGSPVPSEGLSSTFAVASDFIDNEITPSDNKILFADTEFWEQANSGEIETDLNADPPRNLFNKLLFD